MKPLLLATLLCLAGCAEMRQSVIAQLEKDGRAGHETGN